MFSSHPVLFLPGFSRFEVSHAAGEVINNLSIRFYVFFPAPAAPSEDFLQTPFLVSQALPPSEHLILLRDPPPNTTIPQLKAGFSCVLALFVFHVYLFSRDVCWPAASAAR